MLIKQQKEIKWNKKTNLEYFFFCCAREDWL